MMFFSSWSSLIRVIAVGVPLYLGLVLFLRVSGKRTLSKMNAFDFVVTVALGSILATTLLSNQVSLVDGLAAFLLLIVLQWLITWSSVRWASVGRLVKNRPSVLAYRGEPDHAMLRRQRVTERELDAALRSSGLPDVKAALAVILETDGSISVIVERHRDDPRSAIERLFDRNDHE